MNKANTGEIEVSTEINFSRPKIIPKRDGHLANTICRGTNLPYNFPYKNYYDKVCAIPYKNYYDRVTWVQLPGIQTQWKEI